MAPPGMKITWQDIIDGLFPSPEHRRQTDCMNMKLHDFMGKFLAENASSIPPEIIAKSDFVRDYEKYASRSSSCGFDH